MRLQQAVQQRHPSEGKTNEASPGVACALHLGMMWSPQHFKGTPNRAWQPQRLALRKAKVARARKEAVLGIGRS